MSSRNVIGLEGAVGKGPAVPMTMMAAFCEGDEGGHTGGEGELVSVVPDLASVELAS